MRQAARCGGVLTCPTHKVLLRPGRGGPSCPTCGWKTDPADANLVVRGHEKRRIDKLDDLGIIEDPKAFKMQIWPIDDQVFCNRCGNQGAYYYLRQTRRADEPTTAFYECTQCGRKWKHAR